MRKLSLLIALCTLLTVGGVYAAWTYTNETITTQVSEYEMLLTEDQTVGNHGVFAITANDLSMSIDPKAGTAHTTALYIEGSITITFTPDPNAPAAIKEFGPATEFFFELTNNNWKFNDGTGEKNIVTLNKVSDDATHAIHPSNSVEEAKWVKDGSGNFTYTVTTEMLEDHIELTEFVLDTRTDYLNYQSALANGKIKLTVQDAN